MARRGCQQFLDFEFNNHTGRPLSFFSLDVHDNLLGLARAVPFTPGVIANGSTKTFALPLWGGKVASGHNLGFIHFSLIVAGRVEDGTMKELGVFHFKQPAYAYTAFSEDGRLSAAAFQAQWKALGEESAQPVNGRTVTTVEEVKQRLSSHHVFFLANRQVMGGMALHFSAKLKGQPHLIEIKLQGRNTTVGVRSSDKAAIPAVQHALQHLLTR